jgi:hypothetical protein
MKQIALSLILAATVMSCKTPTKSEADWIYLFDGTSTEGWRAYNGKSLPPQWVVKDGALTFDTEERLEVDRKGGNDIIYGLEEFENFELYLEWKIPEGGNSGIFYHLKEGYATPSEVSPEYQLLDDLKWEEINNATLEDWQKTAADYAMHTPDENQKNVKPAGEWNTSRIIFTPDLVEHWFNGKKVVSFEPWTDDWYARKSDGKWEAAPDYGKFKTGYIGLQDHDSPLWFKNIKIKKL